MKTPDRLCVLCAGSGEIYLVPVGREAEMVGRIMRLLVWGRGVPIVEKPDACITVDMASIDAGPTEETPSACPSCMADDVTPYEGRIMIRGSASARNMA